MITLERVKKDINDALLQWNADGMPSHQDAIRLEEKRNAPKTDLLKRRRELERAQELQKLENDDAY